VREVIGPIATPDVIHWAPGLPKTRSGKIMRRILRKIATKCAPAPRSRGDPPAASILHCRTTMRAAAACPRGRTQRHAPHASVGPPT